MKRLLMIAVLGVCSQVALAGEPVYGISKDLGEALEKAYTKSESAAATHGTCVSEYPSLNTCVQGTGATKEYWQCHGIRANHKGSCANKPSDLDNLIKAAKGLSGPAAKVAAAAATGGSK